MDDLDLESLVRTVRRLVRDGRVDASEEARLRELVRRVHSYEKLRPENRSRFGRLP